MKLKIISDSTCDLSEELLEKYDISTIPLYICMGGKILKDGIQVTPNDIYAHIKRKGDLPKTAAPNVSDYLDVFNRWHDLGYEIICFCISSECSSSYQNACIAAKIVGDTYVVDTKNLSTGEGHVVLYGAELAQKGASAAEIQKACNEVAHRVEVSFVIDSIDYLHKGGRCSSLAAFGANLLKLKPCIEVKNGKMAPTKKYRGNIDSVILDYVTDKLKDRTDIVKHRIFITHTGCSPEVVAQVKEKINELMPGFDEITETLAGCTVTAHCGPNTLGILFIREK